MTQDMRIQQCQSRWSDTIPCVYPEMHCGKDVPHMGLLLASSEKTYMHECAVTWEDPNGMLARL